MSTPIHDHALGRRRFLELATLAVTTASLAGATHAGDEPATSAPDADDPLSIAWKRARKNGAPLLVLLAGTARYGFGPYAWSAYLEHASDEAHAHLAFCELVYASETAARARWKELDWSGAASTEFPMLFAIVATSDEKRTVIVSCGAQAFDQRAFKDDVKKVIAPWLAKTEARVNAAIAPDAATFDLLSNRTIGRDPSAKRA